MSCETHLSGEQMASILNELLTKDRNVSQQLSSLNNELKSAEETTSDAIDAATNNQSRTNLFAQITALNTAKKQIQLTLTRIQNESGEYGYCDDCGVEIPLKRLQFNPTIKTCVDCQAIFEAKTKTTKFSSVA